MTGMVGGVGVFYLNLLRGKGKGEEEERMGL